MFKYNFLVPMCSTVKPMFALSYNLFMELSINNKIVNSSAKQIS